VVQTFLEAPTLVRELLNIKRKKSAAKLDSFDV
jgi:hypothetical protein